MNLSEQNNPFAKVSVGYPAKLIMNGHVCFDLFPEWDTIITGSRIDSKHPSQQKYRGQTGLADRTVSNQVLHSTWPSNTANNNVNIDNSQVATMHVMASDIENAGQSATGVTSYERQMPPPPPAASDSVISDKSSPMSLSNVIESTTSTSSTPIENTTRDAESSSRNVSFSESERRPLSQKKTNVKQSTQPGRPTSKTHGRSLSRGPARRPSRSVSRSNDQPERPSSQAAEGSA